MTGSGRIKSVLCSMRHRGLARLLTLRDRGRVISGYTRNLYFAAEVLRYAASAAGEMDLRARPQYPGHRLGGRTVILRLSAASPDMNTLDRKTG
jgi:hypothetical protein